MDENHYLYYKYKLFPTQEQVNLFENYIIANDWVYNWALEKERNQMMMFDYDESEIYRLTEYDLDYLLTIERQNNEWLSTIPVSVLRGGIDRLINAFNKYDNCKNKFPKYKSIDNNNLSNSFVNRYDKFYIDHDRCKISGLPKFQTVYLGFDTGFDKSFRKFTDNNVVSKDVFGNWYISFSIKNQNWKPLDLNDNCILGIDLNARSDYRIVLSNGVVFSEPQSLNRAIIGELESREKYNYYINRRIQYKLQNPGYTLPISSNELKIKHEWLKRSKRVSDINKNFYIETINNIIFTYKPSIIAIEDLNVQQMTKIPNISKIIYRKCFGQFKQMMRDICIKYGIKLIKVPNKIPTSKICSNCGYFYSTFASQEIFICPNCKSRIQRDINAAKNIANYAINNEFSE